MASDRLLFLQARLDHARDQLEAELKKSEARDKGLVISYEKLISGLEGELKSWTHTAGKLPSWGLPCEGNSNCSKAVHKPINGSHRALDSAHHGTTLQGLPSHSCCQRC